MSPVRRKSCHYAWVILMLAFLALATDAGPAACWRAACCTTHSGKPEV